MLYSGVVSTLRATYLWVIGWLCFGYTRTSLRSVLSDSESRACRMNERRQREKVKFTAWLYSWHIYHLMCNCLDASSGRETSNHLQKPFRW